MDALRGLTTSVSQLGGRMDSVASQLSTNPPSVTPPPSQPSPTPAAPFGISREPFIPTPASYSGDLGTCGHFLHQCPLVFDQQPLTYLTDKSRIAFVMSLLCDASDLLSQGPKTLIMRQRGYYALFPSLTALGPTLQWILSPSSIASPRLFILFPCPNSHLHWRQRTFLFSTCSGSMASPWMWFPTKAPSLPLSYGKPFAGFWGSRSVHPLVTTHRRMDRQSGLTRIWSQPCTAHHLASWTTQVPRVEYAHNSLVSSGI